jgi:hypothetical protein
MAFAGAPDVIVMLCAALTTWKDWDCGDAAA